MAAFTLTVDIKDSEEAQASFKELVTSFTTEQDIASLPGIRITNMGIGDFLPSITDNTEK